ncbi:MAG: hypothetical protein LBQ67_04180 [Treponema sp.]|jgi:hypothetical protein|nr:hypothetical protein [Treponema sp.]
MIFCREWRQVGDRQICAAPLADDLSRAAAGLSGEPASIVLFRAGDGCLYLAIHLPNKTPHERLVFMEVTESGGTIAIHNGRVIS